MLQNITKKKILIIDICLIVAGYLYWYFLCRNGQICTTDFKIEILNPTLSLAVGFLPSLILFFLIASDFKTWLKYILSWYLPLSIIAIAQVDPHSSFILSIDRGQAALWWMGGLFVITCIFITVMKLKSRGSVTVGK